MTVVVGNEVSEADGERSDLAAGSDVGLSRCLDRRLLRATGSAADGAEQLDLQADIAMVPNPAPLQVSTLLVVGTESQRSETVDDRLVVVGRLAVDQVEREMKIEVGRSDMRLHPTGRSFYEQTWHRAAHDSQVPAAERAAERPEHVGSDTKEPLAHWIVVCAGARVVIGH